MAHKQRFDIRSVFVSRIKQVSLYLLRFFFKLLYHQLAFAYDWVAMVVSIGKWQSWILSILPFIHGSRILEIGHGPGHLLAALYEKGIVATGIDESRQMGRIAQNNILRAKVYPQLVRGSALILPFSNRSFDQVIMTFPAEFLLKPQTFSEIYRVLVDEGSAIVLPYAWITGQKPLERLAAWLNRVTGEAPQWDEKVIEPLKDLGFGVQWQILEIKSSKVLLIHLKKLHKLS